MNAATSSPWPKRLIAGWRDIKGGFAAWRIWGTMGWQDIRQRYRRSILGPFWITLSMGMMIAAVGLTFGTLFGANMQTYLPFLTLGLLIWQFISASVSDGCQAFTFAEVYIKQVDLPLTTYVYRFVWRNLLLFFHNAAVYVVVALIMGLWPSPLALLALPGLLIVILNCVWVGLLFGCLSTRFRDVPMIVTSVLQFLFFLSPVMWRPEQLAGRQELVVWNPFYHMIELFRAPLLGQVPDMLSWIVGLGCLVCGGTATFVFFARFRNRIAYWL
ncbi:MAG: ABC transporter permease [Alphaproteobacteria bacterium]